MATQFVRIPGVWAEYKKKVQDLSDNKDICGWRSIDVIDHVKDIIESAHGYLAGGFARFVAREQLVPRGPVKLGSLLCDSRDYLHKYISNGGDFDFFFPTEPSYSTALVLTDLRLSTIRSEYESTARHVFVEYNRTQSALGNAETLTLDHHFKLKVQLIKRAFMPCESMLDDFDLVNSMVAISGDDVITHPDWLRYESQKCLHLTRTNSLFFASRLKKYLSRHGYKSLSPETIELVVGRVEDEHSKLLEKPIEMFVQWGPNRVDKNKIEYTASRFLNDVSRLFKVMSSSDIEKFRSAFDRIGAKVIFDDIYKRKVLHEEAVDLGVDSYDYVTQKVN